MDKVIDNRKAKYDYDILEELTCGMSLMGIQAVSIRTGHCSLKDSWIAIEHGEMYAKNIQFSYTGTATNHILSVDEARAYAPIKLLAHKREITNLQHKVATQGLTLIPLYIGKENNKYKLQVGLCRGKKLYDKRQTIKTRDTTREINRELKNTKF